MLCLFLVFFYLVGPLGQADRGGSLAPSGKLPDAEPARLRPSHLILGTRNFRDRSLTALFRRCEGMA
jgi:hypothetical protein